MKQPTKNFGIDVSRHQCPKVINYRALKEQGCTFVIARAAYGITPDETFPLHVAKARTVGLKVGGYLFFRQTKEPAEQLKVFKTQLYKAKIGSGDIIPVLDIEDNERYDKEVSKSLYLDGCEEILSGLKTDYGDAMVYIAPGFFQRLGSPEWLKVFPWWIAHWGVDKPWSPFKEWKIWQFSCTARLKGFPNDLDCNYVEGELPLVEETVLPLVKPSPKLLTHENKLDRILENQATLNSKLDTLLEK